MLDPDVLCVLCLQPAVDYRGLAVTGTRRVTQAGDDLRGLCYSEGRLYVVEGRRRSGRYSINLTVHSVQSDSGHITRLDTLTVLTGLGEGYGLPSLCPRVDRHSRRVFVPCRDSGVIVARLDGDRLVRERTLTCVRRAISVDVMSPDTVYVGDIFSGSVHVVSITDDRIISTLDKPDTVRGDRPYSLAVLGDSVLVGYGHSTLVVYRHGSPAPVRVIPRPGGLDHVRTVSTDCRSNYIVTDTRTISVFIIDSNGDLKHTVNIPDTSKYTNGRLEDCAVVNRQLWVGCSNGDIVIMSSQ